MNQNQFSSRDVLLVQFESAKPLTSKASKIAEKHLSHFTITKSQYSPYQKPESFSLVLAKSSQSFSLMQKPVTHPYLSETSTKSFKAFSKVYQIIEFHEEKKEKQSSVEELENFTINSLNFLDFPGFTSVHNSFSANPYHKSFILPYEQSESPPKRERKSSIFSSIKLKKHSQLLEFKRQAKEKELLMKRRRRAAIKIQAFFRGFRQRKKFAVLWEKYLNKLKLKRLQKIGVRLKMLFAPYVVLNALKKWVRIRQAEKKRMMHLFKTYSAVYIQKNWRGYKIRKKFKKDISSVRLARNKIKALLKGWKIRKILKFSKVAELKKGIKDSAKLLSELDGSSESYLLFGQISSQVSVMKGRILNEINRLYSTGRYFKAHKSSNSVSQVLFESNSPSPVKSRDDQPVSSKPKSEISIIEVKTPGKTFKNFLRRGQNTKFDPKLSISKAKHSRKITENTEAMPEVPSIPLEFEDNSFYAPDKESEDETKLKKDFLKRKSKTYEMTKVEWKGQSRVKCWGDNFKKKQKVKKGLEAVTKLEKMVVGIQKIHVGVEDFLKKRLWSNTRVPQIVPNCRFIEEFRDDGYQDIFEALQSHYLFLCDEE